MNAIKQRKGFETRTYKWDPNSEFVEVEFNTFKEKLKYKIHITDVGSDILYQADNLLAPRIFWWFTTLAAIFCTAYYFLAQPEEPGVYVVGSLVGGVLSITGLFVSNKDDILITNGAKLITLFRDKPNEEEVLNFANFLIAKANEKKKELLINFDLNEEQFTANLNWLHSMRIIDKAELKELQSEFSLKKIL